MKVFKEDEVAADLVNYFQDLLASCTTSVSKARSSVCKLGGVLSEE